MLGILLGPDVTEGATTIQFFAIIYLLMPIFYHFQLPTCLNSSQVYHTNRTIRQPFFHPRAIIRAVLQVHNHGCQKIKSLVLMYNHGSQTFWKKLTQKTTSSGMLG